jgi:hypothetical protein
MHGANNMVNNKNHDLNSIISEGRVPRFGQSPTAHPEI